MCAGDFAQAAACLSITDDGLAVNVSRRTTDSNALKLGAPKPGTHPLDD